MRRLLSYYPMLGLGFLLAVLLLSPTLSTGLLVTDFWHKALLTGTTPIAPPHDNSLLGLFSFYSGEHERTQSIIDLGAAPWWTDLDLKMAFFRPLSELTYWVDYRFWPDNTAFMHAESIAWYLGVVALLGVFVRRLYPDSPDIIPGLSVILFAICGLHAITVTWLACRNALISTFFGLLTLILHDRWHNQPSLKNRALALGALCTTLLTAEYGLSTLVFLACYTLCIDRSPLKTRIASFAPAIIITLIYLAFYSKSGFGTKNSELYTSPSDGLVNFILTIATRIPQMLGADISGVTLYTMQQPFGIKSAAIAFYIIAGLPLMPVLLQSRRAQFFLLGALGSLVPVSSVIPGDRVLLFSSVGIMPVIAEALAYWARTFKQVTQKSQKGVALGALILLVLAHFVVAPLEFAPAFSFAVQKQNEVVIKPVASIQQFPDIANKTAVIINPALPMASASFLPVMATNGKPHPQRLWSLAPGKFPVTLKRVDANTLLITPEKGFLLGNDAWFVHSHRKGYKVGDEFHLAGLTVTVQSLTTDGGPAQALFKFDKPLEDSHFLWLQYKTEKENSDSGICVEWHLPAVGEEVVVKNFG